MTTLERQAGSAIRPFTVQVPEEALDDLRRWPGSLTRDHVLDNITA